MPCSLLHARNVKSSSYTFKRNSMRDKGFAKCSNQNHELTIREFFFYCSSTPRIGNIVQYFNDVMWTKNQSFSHKTTNQPAPMLCHIKTTVVPGVSGYEFQFENEMFFVMNLWLRFQIPQQMLLVFFLWQRVFPLLNSIMCFCISMRCPRRSWNVFGILISGLCLSHLFF